LKLELKKKESDLEEREKLLKKAIETIKFLRAMDTVTKTHRSKVEEELIDGNLNSRKDLLNGSEKEFEIENEINGKNYSEPRKQKVENKTKNKMR